MGSPAPWGELATVTPSPCRVGAANLSLTLSDEVAVAPDKLGQCLVTVQRALGPRLQAPRPAAEERPLLSH